MHRYALVFLISCFVLSATGARAAELTGFGPIKFGMTKEEAWAAINGEGRWETDDRLDYSYYWSEFDMKLTVRQHFRNGRAAWAQVNGETEAPAWYTCVSDALRIVGVIKEKYQITPLIRSGVKDRILRPNKAQNYITDVYYFGFDGGAFINLINEMWEDSLDCAVLLLYYPAHRKPHPF